MQHPAKQKNVIRFDDGFPPKKLTSEYEIRCTCCGYRTTGDRLQRMISRGLHRRALLERKKLA